MSTPDIQALIDKAVRDALAANASAVAPEPESPPPPPAEYYVHLADGRVLQTGDSSSTQIDGVEVIGRYRMSAEAQEAARND